MELIFIIIVIAIVFSNAQKGNTKKGNTGNSVWDMLDKDGSQLLKPFVGANRGEQITKGVRDLEDLVNNLTRKSVQHKKKKEEHTYQKEQEAWRSRQEEEKKRRQYEEQQKKKLELQKKNAEKRKKLLEQQKREQEEKALLERCQVTGAEKQIPKEKVLEQEESKQEPNVIAKQDDSYKVEEYLDPLTASFYPKVDEYLSPTTASFYPDIDVSTFSLQNDGTMI